MITGYLMIHIFMPVKLQLGRLVCIVQENFAAGIRSN